MYQPYNNCNIFFIKTLLFFNIIIPLLSCMNLEANSTVNAVIYLNIFAVHLFYAMATYIKFSFILNNFCNIIFDSEEDFNYQVTQYGNNLHINKFYSTSQILFNFLTIIFLFDVIYNPGILQVNGLPSIMGIIYLVRAIMILVKVFVIYLQNQNEVQNMIRVNELYNKVNRMIVPNNPDNECCICLDDVNILWIKLECNHIFHRNCALSWFERVQSCPICRTEI